MIKVTHLRRGQSLGNYYGGALPPSFQLQTPQFDQAASGSQRTAIQQAMQVNTPVGFHDQGSTVSARQAAAAASTQYLNSNGDPNTGSPGGDDDIIHSILHHEDLTASSSSSSSSSSPHPDQVPGEGPPPGTEGVPVPEYDGGRIVSTSPDVVPQGSFARTWGPPIAVAVAVGVGFWILRR